MPLAMSTELVDQTRQLLVEKGVPPAVADEEIEIVRTELSKEDNADAAKTKLQKIADNLARRTHGASANPDLIADQAKEYYDILLKVVSTLTATAVTGAGVVAVSKRKSIIEEVSGGVGEVFKAVRDVFKDIGLSETPAQQRNTAGTSHPTARGPASGAAFVRPGINPTNRKLSIHELHRDVYGNNRPISASDIEQLHRLDETLIKQGVLPSERINRLRSHVARASQPIKHPPNTR
jgi:hypothetical protein